jgi:predicted MFS family arabinose efflux permease
MSTKKPTNVQLGLRENWKQFFLLVIINAFVGGMVGLERTILPEIAEMEFGIAAKTAILSFIVVFGIVKAITNYYTGALANRFGRKKLLTLGWLVAIPIPFILIYAPSWNWILFANILLGINQGLTWSSSVVMKIDLVGERKCGLAMGLNESAGYLAVGGVAFLTGWIAAEYGVRPYPFYLSIFKKYSFKPLASSGFIRPLNTRRTSLRRGAASNLTCSISVSGKTGGTGMGFLFSSSKATKV